MEGQNRGYIGAVQYSGSMSHSERWEGKVRRGRMSMETGNEGESVREHTVTRYA